jgi:hypothetical protein
MAVVVVVLGLMLVVWFGVDVGTTIIPPLRAHHKEDLSQCHVIIKAGCDAPWKRDAQRRMAPRDHRGLSMPYAVMLQARCLHPTGRPP